MTCRPTEAASSFSDECSTICYLTFFFSLFFTSPHTVSLPPLSFPFPSFLSYCLSLTSFHE
ncbi:hypothetical protein BDQ94DRAFT_137973 [Aspergillus welwitschiae]|uniref:Uncharacterized protein n=1 Tax=Aspergillus welwitschiae TaxID=1341132 RepID=A0A3F3QBP6_9EURO|nr:hypothetical protein BDQ94DRAFT_137973 [Aspergillus welwitschiae]RDH36530.1 hypothetical protein BDQ94DRAFT_137973 [Aspergillus welwitschiae]